MSYTEFEDRLLVACFLAAEENENDTVSVYEVMNRFGLEASDLYIDRAVRGFFVSGHTGHSPWVGDPFDRKIEISAKGVREAERLVSLGISPQEKKVVIIFDEHPDVVESLRDTIADIKKEFERNSVSAELGDQREVVEAEVETAERVVSGRRFNVSSLRRIFIPILNFLADKFLGSALGELAKQAIHLISRLS